MKKMLKVTQIKSHYGRLKNHLQCLKGLGLRKINHSVVVEDSKSNRGMLNKISYLVNIEELS